MKVQNPFRKYNLAEARRSDFAQIPFSHQNQALGKIQKWISNRSHELNTGGIVVLPTGGGKTFTAIRFLCTSVVPKGYKILWLAHTHHLLDQAFLAFEKSVEKIPEPKASLSTRVVSGTPSHHPIHRIEPTDDVVVATLQTITLAFQIRHQALMGFLKEAGDRLCVVFDEAHHAPAPSYRNLLKAMRSEHADMILLGLTATPTNGNPKKSGWMKELFPQGIIHQSEMSSLIADGILARPNFEKIPTNITPNFDENEYQKWVETYRDLPEKIIKSLAENRVRNDLIADYYSKNRERFGKTIIFAERWYQCEQIVSFLKQSGVPAGAVYSKVDASPSTVEARNTKTSDENHQTLELFREGKIDVLLNVRMLTEGTDVPKTQTVFLTRQTTSTTLLTQMVGRALRGPKAGGTAEAFIVSFEDNWSQKINWAGFDQLVVGPTDEEERIERKRLLVQMISIDLVRRLAEQMDSGVNVAPTEFRRLLPVGWYQIEFEAVIEGTEEIETVRRLVMVFDDQVQGYQRFLKHLGCVDLSPLGSEHATLADGQRLLDDSINRFFSAQTDEITRVDPKDLFAIGRHAAQNDGEVPRFFPFEERKGYDLDTLARTNIERNLGTLAIHQALFAEFHRPDRFWTALYPIFELFTTQYDACVRRLLRGPSPNTSKGPLIDESTIDITREEVSSALKKIVKNRDGRCCLCCGESEPRRLQVDHITSRYFGGSNDLENLQTLCKICNREKGIKSVSFLVHCDESLRECPSKLPTLLIPEEGFGKDANLWVQYLRHVVNFFYNAAAVEEVRIGRKGRGNHEWVIRLHDGNRPEWLMHHLQGLLEDIRSARSQGRCQGPEGIRVIGSESPGVGFFTDRPGPTDFPELPNGTECRISIDGEIHEGILLQSQLKFGNRAPFHSFADAYKTILGQERKRNDWRGWELRPPQSAEWSRADVLRKRLLLPSNE